MKETSKSLFCDYYYLIAIIVYFSAIYLAQIRVGVFMSAVMIFFIFYLIKKRAFFLRNELDILVFLYIIYNVLSFYWYLLSGLPIKVFYMEFSNSILPIICFYFMGRINRHESSFYIITLKVLVLCFLVGFYLQITVPPQYIEFMNKIDNSGDVPSAFAINYRSFIGLTTTGSLSAIGFLVSMAILNKSKLKKGKFFLLVCLIALLATFRRSAWFVACFAFVWINYLAIFKIQISKWRLLIFEFLLFFILIVIINSVDSEFLVTLAKRFNLNKAVNERNDSWISGLHNVKNLILGDGLGRYSTKAMENANTKDYIPDGNYFRIFTETGILGSLLFLGTIFTAIRKGLNELNDNYVAIGIIIMICIQAVGSNVFSFQLIAPIFWYSVGRCNRDMPVIRQMDSFNKNLQIG